MRRVIVSIVCAYSRIASSAPASPQPAIAHAAALGYGVEIRDLPDNGPGGWCDPERGQIVVADRLDRVGSRGNLGRRFGQGLLAPMILRNADQDDRDGQLSRHPDSTSIRTIASRSERPSSRRSPAEPSSEVTSSTS
jgi:hypothetical protein